MAINHNAIRATLKWLTIGIFVVALGHKLYQLYKYGGKVPTEPTDSDIDDLDEVEEADYDDDQPSSVYGSKSYND